MKNPSVRNGAGNGMESGMTPHSSVHEAEFRKRYRTLEVMLEHLRNQEQLIQSLQEQAALSDQIKDAAVSALKTENAKNYQVFHDYILNFLTFSFQGLHRVDILLSFSIMDNDGLQFESGSVSVDGKEHRLPSEEGIRWMEPLEKALGEPGRKNTGDTLLDLYKTLELKYDRLLGGCLERCSLLLLEEVYPKEGYHVRIRLPAQAFTDMGF